MRTRNGRILMAGLTVALALCAAAAPSSAGADTTALTARDNGRTVRISQGDTLTIRLGSCEGSCGYRWKTTRAANRLILPRTSSRLRGNVRTWTHATHAPGTTSLRMAYTPPGRQKARRFYSLRVQVVSGRCRPKEETRGQTIIGSSSVARLYSGYEPVGSRGIDVLFGCHLPTNRVTRIWRGTDNRTGIDIDANFPAVADRFAGYVERSQNMYFPYPPTNTVTVFDLSTGEVAWEADANMRPERSSYDEVTALALTDRGDAAWIVQLPEGNELWVRDGSGAVRRGSDRSVDPDFLRADGDTITYRQDGAERSVALR